MPKYLTVKRFHERYCKHIGKIHIKTIYEWIDAEKLKAAKDPGGRNWLIIVDENDPVIGQLAK